MKVAALDYTMSADMSEFVRNVDAAQRQTVSAAGVMSSHLDNVSRAIAAASAAEKERAGIFARGWAETKRLMDISKTAIVENSRVVGDLKGKYEELAELPGKSIGSLDKWREHAAYALGLGMATGIDKAKDAWDAFKSWTERTATIWAIGLASAIAAGILTAVYAAYKAIGFAVGLLTGESYKSANIDALIAANKQVTELQGQLHIGATEAGALGDALARLGTPKDDYVSVWHSAATAVHSNTEELDRLGVAYKDSNGQLLKTEQFLQNVKTKLGEYTEGWDRNQAAAAIGVGSLEKVSAVLQVTQGELQRSQERLNDYNLGIGPETQAAVAAYQAAMREFDNETKLTSEGFKRAIADQVMPILTEFAEFFREGWPKVVNAFRYSMAEITSLLYGLKMVVGAVYESIAGSLGATGSLLMGLAVAAGRALTGDFSGARQALVQGWEDAKTRLGQIGDNIVEQARRNAAAMKLAWGFDDRQSGAGAAPGGMPWTPKPPKPEEVKAITDPYDALIKSLQEKAAAMALDTDATERATEAEKAFAKYQEDLTQGYITFNAVKDKSLRLAIASLQTSELERREAELAAKQLAEANAEYLKSWDAIDGRTQQLLKEIEAQTEQNARIGLSVEAIAALDAAKLQEQATARDRLATLADEIDASGFMGEAYRKEAEALRALAAVKLSGAATQADFDRFKEFWQSIDRTAHDVFTNILDGGSNLWKKLKDTGKAIFFDWLYQMTLRKWIFSFVASASGPAGAAAAASTSALGSSVLGTSALGGGSLLGAGASATMSNGLIGGFGANMANIGTLMEGGSYMTALSAAAPYLVAGIAALTAVGSLFKSKGGPKADGRAGLTYSGIGDFDNSLGAGVSPALAGLQTQYQSLAQSFGAQAAIQFGIAISRDPKGTAPTFLEVAATKGGKALFSDTNLNVGRSDEEMQKAIADATTRALFLGLKESDMAAQYRKFFDSVANDAPVADMAAAIERATGAMKQRGELEEQIYLLSHTDLEILNRTRERERAAVDESNAALLERLYSLQDEKTAAEAAAKAQEEAARAQEEAARAAEQAAEEARRTLVDSVTAGTDAAYSALERAVGAQRDAAQLQLGIAQEQVSTLQGLFGMLKGEVASLYGESAAAMLAAQGRKFIDDALGAALSTGYLPDQTALSDAISGVRGSMGDVNYNSAFEAQRDRLVLAGKLSQLKDVSGNQLTTAEKQLQAAKDQIKDLDGILKSAHDQIDALRGIDTSVLSVRDAIDRLAAALAREGAVTGGSLTGGLTEQWVKTATGQMWQSSGGAVGVANASGFSVTGKSGTSYSGDSLRDWVNAQAADPMQAYLGARKEGISANSLDHLMGWADGTSNTWADNVGVPRFAAGGWHDGGWAMVGESGPELAYMPPARIYNAKDSRSIAGDDGGATAAEIRQLRQDNQAQARAIAALNARMVKLLERFEADGLYVRGAAPGDAVETVAV